MSSLILLLIIPLLGVLFLFFQTSYNFSEKFIKVVGLATLISNLILSLIIFIIFDFSGKQFQFIQVEEYYKLNYFDLYLGVDGISIYFVLLTTIIIPLSLISN